MPDKIKILIGEDEVLIAEYLADILNSFEYDDVEIAHNKNEIIDKVKSYEPDLALLDIRMEGKYDGIEIGEYITENLDIPIIYITAHSDKEIVQKALKTKPSAYIIKPFTEMDVFSAVEIAINSMAKKEVEGELVIKDGHAMVKVKHSDILFITASGNYAEIQTSTKKYLNRTSLDNLLSEIDSPNFIRIHRSHIVNAKMIDIFHANEVSIQNQKLPISRRYKEKLKDYFTI